MTKTEEALCNGITFSVLRLIAPAVQEGELENALYYAHVLLTADKNKLVIKIWRAPDYSLLQFNGKDVDSFTVEVSSHEDADASSPYGYSYGGDTYREVYRVWVGQGHLMFDYKLFGFYSGLMIYPAVKCIIVDLIKDMVEKTVENKKINSI